MVKQRNESKSMYKKWNDKFKDFDFNVKNYS